jgi:hypothetical protein
MLDCASTPEIKVPFLVQEIGLLIKGGRFTKQGKFRVPLKKEANTGAHQMLPEIPLVARFDLGARVVEVVIFDKSAHLRIEKVI